MATLTVNTLNRTGVDMTGTAAAPGGDVFPNTGKEWVEFDNGDASPVTVTVAITKQVDGVSVTGGKQITVPANKRISAGPFAPADYSVGNKSGGNVALSYSGTTNLNVKVTRFPG